MPVLDLDDFPANGTANFNSVAETAFNKLVTATETLNTALDSSLAAGDLATEYDSGKVDGYAAGDSVYSATTGFTYRALQTQAQGAVQALTSTAYWALIAGDNKSELVYAIGSITTNTQINLANGIVQTCTIGGNLTLTVTGWPATGSLGMFILDVTNGGAYTLTITFGTLAWHTGTAPSLLSSGVNRLQFTTKDGGTTVQGREIWRSA